MADWKPYPASLLAAMIAFSGAALRAQADEPFEPESRRGSGRTLAVDVSNGWSATSLFGGVTDPGRGTLSAAVHAQLPLIAGPRFALDYTAGVVPVELAVGTRVAGPRQSLVSRTVYGAGLDGVGLTARFRGLGRWEPYLVALGGVRLFTAPVPDPRGLRFNFSADLGGGVAVRLARGQRLKLGVSLHHLSNGGLGRANPSFNGFTVSVGFEGLRSRAGHGGRS
ncbi:MAG: acyloxyacyl hydrolase [Vicinamibacteria bacterium]